MIRRICSRTLQMGARAAAGKRRPCVRICVCKLLELSVGGGGEGRCLHMPPRVLFLHLNLKADVHAYWHVHRREGHCARTQCAPLTFQLHLSALHKASLRGPRTCASLLLAEPSQAACSPCVGGQLTRSVIFLRGCSARARGGESVTLTSRPGEREAVGRCVFLLPSLFDVSICFRGRILSIRVCNCNVPEDPHVLRAFFLETLIGLDIKKQNIIQANG